VTSQIKAFLRGAVAALTALACRLLLAAPVAAHGGITGLQDVVQDYGVLVFLIAIVLVGAGVVTWVALSPEPEPEPEAEGAPPNQGVSNTTQAPEWGPTPAQAVSAAPDRDSA
jgi:hypothetical protein